MPDDIALTLSLFQTCLTGTWHENFANWLTQERLSAMLEPQEEGHRAPLNLRRVEETVLAYLYKDVNNQVQAEPPPNQRSGMPPTTGPLSDRSDQSRKARNHLAAALKRAQEEKYLVTAELERSRLRIGDLQQSLHVVQAEADQTTDRLVAAEARAEELAQQQIADAEGTQATLHQVQENIALHQTQMQHVTTELEEEIAQLKQEAAEHAEAMQKELVESEVLRAEADRENDAIRRDLDVETQLREEALARVDQCEEELRGSMGDLLEARKELELSKQLSDQACTCTRLDTPHPNAMRNLHPTPEPNPNTDPDPELDVDSKPNPYAGRWRTRPKRGRSRRSMRSRLDAEIGSPPPRGRCKRNILVRWIGCSKNSSSWNARTPPWSSGTHSSRPRWRPFTFA